MEYKSIFSLTAVIHIDALYMAKKNGLPAFADKP